MLRVLAAAVVLSALACAENQERTVQQIADSVLVLNRTGQWGPAERLATKALQQAPVDREMIVRCQLTESLAYAQVRQNNPAAASSTLRVYAGACASVPEMRGFASEVADLEREIATSLAPRKS